MHDRGRQQQKAHIKQMIAEAQRSRPKEDLCFYRQQRQALEAQYRTAKTPAEKARLKEKLREARATEYFYREFPADGIRTAAFTEPGGRFMKCNEEG